MINSTKVADLTVDQLKNVIRETVTQTLAELLSHLDEGLILREKSSSKLFATFKEPQAHYKRPKPLPKI